MAIANSSNNIQNLLSIFRNRKSTSDDLCEAAKELLMLQVENNEVTNTLVERISRGIDPSWVRKELLAALSGTISAQSPYFLQVKNLLRKTLDSSLESPDVRGSAAIGLAVLGLSESTELLILILERELAKSDIGLIYSLILALKILHDPESISVLIKSLNLEIPTINIAAAEALGSFGPLAKDALPPLRELALRGTDSEKQSAHNAVISIEKL